MQLGKKSMQPFARMHLKLLILKYFERMKTIFGEFDSKE